MPIKKKTQKVVLIGSDEFGAKYFCFQKYGNRRAAKPPIQ